MSEFKTGDLVRKVTTGSYDQVLSISEETYTCKIHAGNGNVIVGGQQFSSAGYERGRSVWSSTTIKLVLVGSDELQEYKDNLALGNRKAAALKQLKDLERILCGSYLKSADLCPSIEPLQESLSKVLDILGKIEAADARKREQQKRRAEQLELLESGDATEQSPEEN